MAAPTPSHLRASNFPRPIGERWAREDSTPLYVPPAHRPDAATFPRPGAGVPDLDGDTKESAVMVAERLLECGPHELAWVRDQASYLFATRDVEDCEFFPTGHELAGKPRYRWVDLGEGIRIGWLIDG